MNKAKFELLMRIFKKEGQLDVIEGILIDHLEKIAKEKHLALEELMILSLLDFLSKWENL